MNLNPFNPNYLNQMNFQQKTQKKLPQRHIQSATKTPIKKNKSEDERNIAESNIKQSIKSLSAKFILQNHLNTSNLLYTSQGFLFAYLRKQNLISGRSFIIFPEGIVAHCNVINRKLSGWIAVCKKGQFYNISHFFGGRFHGDQFTYDIKCGLTMESRYTSGKLQSVKRGFADSHQTFQKRLKSKQLVQLLNETLQFTFYERYFPKIESKLGNFYGVKTKQMPNGLGVLITSQEYIYGNFQYGLLAGNGVMVFPNGNSYIGQFDQGMMTGYGNYIKRGNTIFQFNQSIISETQYKDQKNISSFYENTEISNIFYPIVQFYQKLNAIYQNRRKELTEKSESFVDVQVENEPQQDKQQISSGNYTPREDIITELLKSNSPKENIQNEQNNEEKPQVNKATGSKSKPDKHKKEETHDPVKSKSKKEKWIMRDDNEWNEIIEELGEENVSKQDDFLHPQGERINVEDSQQLKKNPLNSRLSAQTAIKNTDSSPDAMDRFQNHLIGKITLKK